MNKDKINKEKKEKAKNIAFKILHGVSYALSTCFIATCIVACASSSSKKTDNSPKSLIQYRIDGESESQSESESVSYPIYDDSNYTITLSDYQLNNYNWSNLSNYLKNNESLDAWSIVYNGNQYEFDEVIDGAIFWLYNSTYYIQLIYDYNEFNSANDTNYNKYQFIYNNGDYVLFDNYIVLDLVGSEYSNIKPLIQLDILANESPTSDIFTAISDSLSNFVITLNTGFTALISLFWNSSSSSLTVLGVLTTIVVGTALVFFGFKLVMRLIRLRS